MLIAISLFALLLFPYMNLIPTLDGRHDLVNTFHLSLNKSIHPPFKSLILMRFIEIHGIYSYTWMGLLFGIGGIIGIYLLTKMFTDKKSAVIASLLLSICGLYVSSSLFSMTDFIITILAIYTFYFYYTQRLGWYSFVTILGVMTKETYALVPLSILIVSLLQRKFKWRYLFFLLAFIEWLIILKVNHLSAWNQQNFSNFSKYGSFGTIFFNIVTLKIFNKYAFGAWQQLLVLNFNWFFWLVALIQFGAIKWSKNILKYYSPIILFVILYVFFVLSFPTWIIPRYMLPIWPFLLIFLSAHIWRNKVILVLIFLVSFMSLFYSIDPISHGIYKDRELFKQKFYNVPFAGNDGITYNMQYLDYTKRVNKEYFKNKIENCYDVFLGMKDDKELRSIYHFPVKPCP
jgi:4-amino-4-deoxy-L-arabinose transferase-like glycosyltransferase